MNLLASVTPVAVDHGTAPVVDLRPLDVVDDSWVADVRLVPSPSSSPSSAPAVDDHLVDFLRAALEAAMAGRVRRPTEVGEHVLFDEERAADRFVLVSRRGAVSTLLSPRELEIARLVARGHTNRLISRELGISSWTVSTHLRRIFAKLDVCSRAEMVARVFGVLALPEPRRSAAAQNPRAVS